MDENKIFSLINLPNTYIGEAPTLVNDCQWIVKTGGSTLVHFTKSNYDKPTFSIYARGTNNEETSQRLQEIFERIRNWADSMHALIIRRLPSFVGKDDKRRSIYTFQIEYQYGGY